MQRGNLLKKTQTGEAGTEEKGKMKTARKTRILTFGIMACLLLSHCRAGAEDLAGITEDNLTDTMDSAETAVEGFIEDEAYEDSIDFSGAETDTDESYDDSMLIDDLFSEAGEEDIYEYETEYDDLFADEELSGDLTEDYLLEEESEEVTEEEIIEEELTESEELLSASEGYTYEIFPVLPPFNHFFYVRTDNPDPESFRFFDMESGLSDKENGLLITIHKTQYLDVVYENEETCRVHGGYVFYGSGGSDGGALSVQLKNEAGKWNDCGEMVECPEVTSPVQYFMDTYIDSEADFFTNMRDAESVLDSIAMYPAYVAPESTEGFYPNIYSNPHEEMNLMEQFDSGIVLNKTSFVYRLYPYVLDSLGFPGFLNSVARKLDPSCTVGSAQNHWETVITHNGRAAVYGGAGKASDGNIAVNQLEKRFIFDSSSGDLFGTVSLSSLHDLYDHYIYIGGENVKNNKKLLKASILGEEGTVAPGGWIKIAVAGLFGQGGVGAYAYITHSLYPVEASNAWVDGRYVNKCEYFMNGVKYEDYPDADIILRDVVFRDKNGDEHCEDLWYRYKGNDRWSNVFWFNDLEDNSLNYLTREQVEQMGVDRNTNWFPDSGKVYDGTMFPGTEFENIHLENINIPSALTVEVGDSFDIPVTLTPAGAFDRLGWETSDGSVAAYSKYEGKGFAYEAGTTVITVRGEGNIQASCVVTVRKKKAELRAEGELLKIDAGTTLSNLECKLKTCFADVKTGEKVSGKLQFCGKEGSTALTPGIWDIEYEFSPYDSNYEKLTGTVRVEAVKRKLTSILIENGKTSLTAVSGTKVSEVTVRNNLFLDKSKYVYIKGSFSFDGSDCVLKTGEYDLSWTFRPDDENYEDYTGVFHITVVKDTPVIASWPKAGYWNQNISLSEMELEGGSANVPGHFEWKNADSIFTGYAAEAIFIPDDLEEYETVSGKVYPYLDYSQKPADDEGSVKPSDDSPVPETPAPETPVIPAPVVPASRVPAPPTYEQACDHSFGDWEYDGSYFSGMCGKCGETIEFQKDTDEYRKYILPIQNSCDHQWEVTACKDMTIRTCSVCGKTECHNHVWGEWMYYAGIERVFRSCESCDEYEVFYAGSSGYNRVMQQIEKAGLQVSGNMVTVAYGRAAKKALTVKAEKAFSVKNAIGKITYKKIKGSKKIKVCKDGRIKLKKGLKKGTYKLKVKVTASGTGGYKKQSSTTIVRILVG